MNYNRNAYDSASAWVTAVKNEDFWKRQLKRLEKNSSKEFPQLYNDALDQLKRGSWDYMWKTYKPDGEKMAEKIWEGGEVTVPQMENLTVALLTLEWLEKQKGGSHDVNPILKTDEAKKLLEKLVAAEMLKKDWQPIGLSCTERALLALKICEHLGIKTVWKTFGKLWGEKPETLRSYKNKALDQMKSLIFQDKLKKVFG